MVVLAVAALLGQVDAGTLTPAASLIAQTSRRELVVQLLDDGRHVRFGTDGRGAVNTWRPQTYKPETALTVVYVHGFFDNADTAFWGHHLAEQFRDSARNALFIVPEAPSWRTDDVVWRDLDELLAATEKQARVTLPKGPVWVIAHSGAYRTAQAWLSNPKVERVILLDALYSADDDFTAWVKADGATHRLTVIGFETAQRTEWFLRAHPNAVKLDDVPFLYDLWKPALTTAPVLYLQSERFGHMELVTSGRVLPVLLHSLK
ncbi:MAG: hypothetical protein JNK82_04275 [Myxococcaceae bacterium]|nr:hypothetical protein [Myxococcaceae bacterium]